MASVAENLNVLAKEVFAEGGVPDLIPNATKIQNRIKFRQKDMLGLKYVQTVRLSYPNGFTHAKGDGTAGAFTLRGAGKGNQGRAEIQGAQIILQDQMSYEDAAKCSGGKESFVNGTDYFFEGMQMSTKKRLESEVMYGGQGLGLISGTPATSGSNKVITVKASEWASGIWIGNEGMALDVYDDDNTTKLNTNADVVVVSVDVVAKTVTVSGNSSDLAAMDDGDYLYYAGAFGNEMTGIHGILNNTGILFNIDASVYALWKSTQYAPTAGQFNFQKLKKAIALSVSKGLDEDIVLFVSPGAWSDLQDSIEALRKTDDKDVKKVEIGTNEIVYHSQNGSVEIVASLYVKEGYAYGLCMPHWKRLGAKDVTYKTPGFGEDMFFQLTTQAGVEARLYTNQAVFCFMPAKQFIISNIVNSA